MAATASLVFVWFLMRFVMGTSRFVGGGDFFDFYPSTYDGTNSISANLGTPNWLTVTNPMPAPTAYAPWQWLPVVSACVCIVVLSLALAMVFERKEEK
jgi:hypothetical protein